MHCLILPLWVQFSLKSSQSQHMAESEIFIQSEFAHKIKKILNINRSSALEIYNNNFPVLSLLAKLFDIINDFVNNNNKSGNMHLWSYNSRSYYRPGIVRRLTFITLTHSLTYSWSWALLEKLPIVHLLKNFPAFYGTRRFIAVFTRVLHWSLSWAKSIQSISYLSKIHFNIVLPL
jgi:hypothetical protein